MSDPTFEALSTRPDAVLWTIALSGAVTDISDSIVDVRGLAPDKAKVQTAQPCCAKSWHYRWRTMPAR